MIEPKLFLASSEELEQERIAVRLMIGSLNKEWKKKNIFLKPVDWKDLLHSFRGDGKRIQDYFNEEMLKCDIVIVLFFKRVGQFTLEEFRLAYENLKKGNKPCFLLVYFKKGNVPIDEINEEILKIGKLKNEIEQYNQLYGSFKSAEDLSIKLHLQLEKMVSELQNIPSSQDLENYQRHLVQSFIYLDLTGMKAKLKKPLELESIYIMHQTKAVEGGCQANKSNNPEQIKASTFEKEKANKSNDFLTQFTGLYRNKYATKLPMRMLILGYPGSGKTTLMKWIVLQCFQEKEENIFYDFIPVLIPLEKLGRDPNGTFLKYNISQISKLLNLKQNLPIDSFYDEYFRSNRLLFLFDGLDEIVDKDVRRDVIEWLQNQYIGQNPLIITSRCSGLIGEEQLVFRNNVPMFEIQNFDMDDVELFLQKWYSYVMFAGSGEDNSKAVNEEGTQIAKELYDVIREKNNESLQNLTVNPLLLSIIAIINRNRTELPRERHNLYKGCIEVMIMQWPLFRGIKNIRFTFEDSIEYLSRIALRLMESKYQELDKVEIKKCCFPPTIGEDNRDLFLNEMVEKLGILYESEGNLGFQHLTFQEYLTAWYFANSENQNEILKHYKNQYWEDTFKLFVNMGDAELLFKEVIDNLLNKHYWSYMKFWEICLKEIDNAERRERIEVYFARSVAEILSGVELGEQNAQLINQLYVHYPLFKYAHTLERQGWKLLNDSLHPFAKAVGISLLYRATSQIRRKLIAQVKKSIKKYDAMDEENEEKQLNFLFQNINGFMILILDGNVTDFNFSLELLRSKKSYIQFLVLFALRHLKSLKELRDLRGIRDLIDLWDLQYLRDPQGLKDIEDLWYLRSIRDLRYNRGFWHLKYLYHFINKGELVELEALGLLNLGDILSIKGSHIIQYLENTYKSYSETYKVIFENHKKEIERWGMRAVEKLHNLSDKEILEYFPNTDKEELPEFRMSS